MTTCITLLLLIIPFPCLLAFHVSALSAYQVRMPLVETFGSYYLTVSMCRYFVTHMDSSSSFSPNSIAGSLPGSHATAAWAPIEGHATARSSSAGHMMRKRRKGFDVEEERDTGFMKREKLSRN